MSTVIEFAEKRLADSINAKRHNDIIYWSAYLDGARAILREIDNAAS